MLPGLVPHTRHPPFRAVNLAVTGLAFRSHARARALLQSFGVTHSDELRPDQYAAVIERARRELAQFEPAPDPAPQTFDSLPRC